VSAVWLPQVGDDVVDLRQGSKAWDNDRAGSVVQVKTVTTSLVLTSDGEKYRAGGLYPIGEGLYSSRRLVAANDPRVLCIRGRDMIAEIARLADNLSKLDRKDPAEVSAALAQLAAKSGTVYQQFGRMMADASRQEREGGR
jgi:hypothetical protein